MHTYKSLPDESFVVFVISSPNFTTLLHHKANLHSLWFSMSLFPGGQLILVSSVFLYAFKVDRESCYCAFLMRIKVT